VQCAGNSEPTFVNSPSNKLNLNTHRYSSDICRKSFSESWSFDAHVESNHPEQTTLASFHKPARSKQGTADSTLTTSDNTHSSLTGTQKSKLLIVSLDPINIKAFVQDEIQPGWVRQEFKTYTREAFCELDGGTDALKDFLNN
jgi:hypothetical protein